MKYLDPETGENVDIDHTPEFLKDLEEFYANACQHPDSQLCQTQISGGGIQVRAECQVSGKLVGPAKPQNAASATLPMKSVALANLYLHSRKTAHQKILLRHWQLQQGRDSNWWASYKVYLASPEWAEKRRKVLERAAEKCEGCGDAVPVEVHHLSYAHLFDEFLFELVALCSRCHRTAHPDGDIELPCCGCRFQTEEHKVDWCGKLNVPAKAALSATGRCGSSAKVLEPLRRFR